MTLRKTVGTKRQDISPHPFTTDVRTNLILMRLGVDSAVDVIAAKFAEARAVYVA